MIKRIAIVAVFLVGCAVGGGASAFVVPKASAQQAATLTRWEYSCFPSNDYGHADDLAQQMNSLGAQRWELTAVDSSYWCFKRPKM